MIKPLVKTGKKRTTYNDGRCQCCIFAEIETLTEAVVVLMCLKVNTSVAHDSTCAQHTFCNDEK